MGMHSRNRSQARVLQASFAPGRARVVQASAHAARVPTQALTLPPRGSGHPLPPQIRQQMERALGADFSDVRVHVGTEASRIGALAFTTGSDIYFAHGQYNVASPAGQQLIGHELVHVVQQRAGRVRNPFGSDLAVVQDPALEAEADRIARRALQPAAPPHGAIGARVQSAVQRKTIQRNDEIKKLSIWKVADSYDAKSDSALGGACAAATAELQAKADAEGLKSQWVAILAWPNPTSKDAEDHFALEVELPMGKFVLDVTYRQFETKKNLAFKPAKTYVGEYDAWKRLMQELYKTEGVKAMRGARKDVEAWSRASFMVGQTFSEAPGEVVNKPPGF